MKSSSALLRFSVSMPGRVVRDLDRVSRDRGFANRSQCLTAMIREAVVDHDAEEGDSVMMGLVTFIYDHRKRNLQNKLADIQHRYLKEIVTIQLVHLEKNQSFQILLVQGPARTLRAMADAFGTQKGVHYGKLQLSTNVLPPLHEGETRGGKR
ncbi:MAG: nickel-responsive transcriptional regulator NikR [Blastochloris sp.]|nr:nickel-responsive transcriptional regulator NikR [Blastochloris sp.]